MQSTPRKRKSPKASTSSGLPRPSANAPRSPASSPERSPISSPGNHIGSGSPVDHQKSPSIGLTAREAAAAVGRTVKRPRKEKPGESPGKDRKKKAQKRAPTAAEICEDPFKGVRRAGGKSNKSKKKTPAKVWGNTEETLNFPFFSPMLPCFAEIPRPNPTAGSLQEEAEGFGVPGQRRR